MARSKDGEGVLSGTLLALVAQLTTAAFTAVLVIYLSRELGAKGFGLFALALSISGIAQLLADFGISFSAARFIAERRGSPEAVAGLLAAALRLKLALATAVTVLLVALAGPLEDLYGQDDLVWPLRGVALALWGESIFALYRAAFSALRQNHLNVQVIFAESLVETGASIALVAGGAGVSGAAFGRAIGYSVGAIVAAAVAIRVVGRGAVALRRARSELVREVAAYGRPLFVTNSAYTLFATIDIQLISFLLTSTAVGLFAAPLRLISFLGYIGQSVASAVSPRMTREDGREPDASAFNQSLRWLVLFQALLIAPLLVWADPIVDLLLGADFAESADVLRALAPYVFLYGLGTLITTTVNFLGEANRRIRIVVAALVLNAAIDLALLRELGVIAAAIGTGVAYSFYVPAHFAICRRAFDIPLRPLATTFLRALLATAAMAGVLALAGTDELSLAGWLLGGAGGLAAFVLTLVVTREVSAAELRSQLRR